MRHVILITDVADARPRSSNGDQGGLSYADFPPMYLDPTRVNRRNQNKTPTTDCKHIHNTLGTKRPCAVEDLLAALHTDMSTKE